MSIIKHMHYIHIHMYISPLPCLLRQPRWKVYTFTIATFNRKVNKRQKIIYIYTKETQQLRCKANC